MEGGGEEGEDRISQLPDAILQHILSFVDINQALQTTILSTRWKNLCFSLSDLHFNLSRAAALAGVSLKNWQSARDFSDQSSLFISRYLSHRDASAALRNFHLSFDGYYQVEVDAEFVEKCVSYAVNHGVESLHLHALCYQTLRFPAAFFSCKSLRELKLTDFHYGIYLPEGFSLPNVKTLHLEGSKFVYGDVYGYSSLKEPFSGFPELEKLILRHTITFDGLVISAPKLRFLEIVQDTFYSQGIQEVSAPLLTSFRYESSFPLQCSNVNLPILEEVYVNIYKTLGQSKELKYQKRIALKCVCMLQQLRSAKVVALTLDTVKVLEMGRDVVEQSPSPFPYVKCLKLIRKGRRVIPTVVKKVIKYLTEGSLYSDVVVVEIPEGVCVVEEKLEELFDQDSELNLQELFGIEDET